MEKIYIGIETSREIVDELVKTDRLLLRTGQKRTYPSLIVVGEPSEALMRYLSDALDNYCRNTTV